MEVPIEGSKITADEKVCNKSMSKSRITVKWIFKEIQIQWTALESSWFSVTSRNASQQLQKLMLS